MICSCAKLTSKTLLLYNPAYVQAASGDGHPMAIEDSYVVVPAVDDGWAEQVRQRFRA